MRLINVHTYGLEEFDDELQVQYAILSHRWGEEEVIFKDLDRYADLERPRAKKGWHKIEEFCKRAAEFGFNYAWVDTCCIDKSSSAELQEAINSMYKWYNEAGACYVYLSDVHASFSDPFESVAVSDSDSLSCSEQIKRSQWFRRGWTLQELLAPRNVIFYNADWNKIGDRSSLLTIIHAATNIPPRYLAQGFPDKDFRPCVAEIMSWASHRKTTRPEDRAYSLLGLFDVNMPMLYGEGEKAFTRLQEEIIRNTDDQSIFAWEGVGLWRPGLLAKSPDNFPVRPSSSAYSLPSQFPRRKDTIITNQGISVELNLIPLNGRTVAAVTHVGVGTSIVRNHGDPFASEHAERQIGFFLRRLDAENRWARIPGSFAPFGKGQDLQAFYNPSVKRLRPSKLQLVTVVRSMRHEEKIRYMTKDVNSFEVGDFLPPCPDHDFQVDEDFSIKGSKYDPSTHVMASDLPESIAGLIKYTGCVNSNHSSWGQDGISAIALGFDYHFNPTCILNVIGNGYSSDSEERFRRIIAIEGGYQEGRLLVADGLFLIVEGGQWRRHGVEGGGLQRRNDKFLAIKTTLARRDNGRGLVARLVSCPDTFNRTLLTVKIHREAADYPWRVTISLQHSGMRVAG